MSKGVVFEGVSKQFDGAAALGTIDLSIGEAEIVVLLGASGCGKTTLLNLAAGFLKPSAGRVLVSGEQVDGPSPTRGVCFQEAALFPWLSVLENVLFGPRAQGRAGAAVRAEADNLLAECNLSGFRKHRPSQLSGGMRQRVALARLLINRPNLLLMDEPFGALDAQTRLQMQDFLLQVHMAYRPTVLFVTHDVEEAIYLGDRVVILGRPPHGIVKELIVNEPRPRSREFLLGQSFLDAKKSALRSLWGEQSQDAISSTSERGPSRERTVLMQMG